MPSDKGVLIIYVCAFFSQTGNVTLKTALRAMEGEVPKLGYFLEQTILGYFVDIQLRKGWKRRCFPRPWVYIIPFVVL